MYSNDSTPLLYPSGQASKLESGPGILMPRLKIPGSINNAGATNFNNSNWGTLQNFLCKFLISKNK